MKTLFGLILIVFLSTCKYKDSNSIKTLDKKQSNFYLFTNPDSGFINKKSGYYFLLSNTIADSSETWKSINDSDTIGKYYKINDTENYLMCLTDFSEKHPFTTHLLIESDKNGNMIHSERYFHSQYPCCWKNNYDGFNQYEEYFGIKTCGTGSGYCFEYIYLFKKLLPQEIIKPIPKSYWSANPEYSQHLTSSMKIDGNKIIMSYKSEEGNLDENSNFIVKKIEKFKVDFIYENNTWHTPDSSKFEGLDISW